MSDGSRMLAMIDFRPAAEGPGDRQVWGEFDCPRMQGKCAWDVVQQVSLHVSGYGDSTCVKRIEQHGPLGRRAGQGRYVPRVLDPALADGHDAPVRHPPMGGGIVRIELDRFGEKVPCAHEIRSIEPEDALDGGQKGLVSCGDFCFYRRFGDRTEMEYLRIDLRYHVIGDLVLQREQVVQMSVEAATPDHFEIEYDIREPDIDANFVVDDLNGAFDDVIKFVRPATRHRVGGEIRTIPERASGDQAGRAKPCQGGGNFLCHPKCDAATNRCAHAAERQYRHPPTQLVSWKISQAGLPSPPRRGLELHRTDDILVAT